MIKKYIADFGIKLPPQYAEILRTLCFISSNNTSETEGSEANKRCVKYPRQFRCCRKSRTQSNGDLLKG